MAKVKQFREKNIVDNKDFKLRRKNIKNEKIKSTKKNLKIEENSNDDMCRQKQYGVNSGVICGYGTPRYN